MIDERPPMLQRAPILLMPLLVMALSASLAKLLWMIVAPIQDISAAPMVTSVTPIQSQQTQNFGRIIADTHIFGEVPKAAPQLAVVAQPPTPPPTPVAPSAPPMRLSLHGLWAKKKSKDRSDNDPESKPIISAKDLISKLTADLDSLFVLNVAKSAKNIPPEKSRGGAFAIISPANGDQKMYSEGDNIADGVKVLEIFSDRVVVDNRGARQEIFLSDGNNNTTSISQNSGNQQRPNSSSQRIQESAGPSAPRKIENLGQQDLRTLRNDIMNDVSILAQFSAPEPLLMDGEVKGFRLHLSNRLRLLYQIGFRPGDVITELNGVRLNDPDTIQQTLYNFIGSDQLAVSVMRGQEEETFRYSFE